MGNYSVLIKNSAQNDLKKLKSHFLKSNFQKLLKF